MITYLVITGIVIAVFVTMSLIKVKSKKEPKSILDELNEDSQFQKLSGIYDAMSKLNNNPTDKDIIPEGYGEFGYEATNPIPVKSIMGNLEYLNMLRTNDGTKVQFERLGSTGASNIHNPIDAYDIFAKGNKVATLYLSPYNLKNSKIPPRGFKFENHY